MSALVDRLRGLRRRGVVEHVDAGFATWIADRDPSVSDPVVMAACLASSAGSAGDVCLDLARVAGTSPWPDDAPDLAAPDLASWKRDLASSTVVAVADTVPPRDLRPLILDGDRLYLYRVHADEARVARGLRHRASSDVPAGHPDAVERALAALFGDPAPPEAADQRDAARAALSSRLTVISGGPGTGKTTTVVRILALLATLSPSAPRIRLAAPTGKAATRLGKAIEEGLDAMRASGVDPEVLDAIPVEATTVHRMIGAAPGGRPPRFGRDRRLVADVVVVDEASMLDLALAAQLLDALPDDARLILLGDRDQLASVEAGAVLGDVCAAADVEGSPLHGRLAVLTHSFRFREDGGIGKLAAAIRRGDVDGALAALRDDDPEAAWHDGDDVREPLRSLLAAGYARFVDAVPETPSDDAGVAAALDAFDRFRVLCAVKDGPRGVAAVNRLAEASFGERLGIPRRTPWYRGRPVLVTRNDRSVRLVNGDVGVTVPVADDNGEVTLRVAFRAEGGGVRTVSTARLPEHETCWAMTVHKSQGSEFDRVALVLPDIGPGGPSPVATRELAYTGVTRARARVDLFATGAALRAAVERRTERVSGLREALARPRD